jgi:hypothetical protein
MMMSGMDQNTVCIWNNIDFWVPLTTERDSDFLMKFQDTQFHMLQKPNAVLSSANSKKRFERIMKDFSMDDVVATELFRWGYTTWSIVQWRALVDKIMNVFIPTRTDTLITQYRTANLHTPVKGVIFSLVDKAIVKSPAQLVMTPHGSQGGDCLIYYTKNDEDPRLPGGVVNSNASSVALGGSITLTTTTKVTARIKSKTEGWGPINDVLIYVGDKKVCLMCKSIIFTEVSFHPDQNKSHFVEIKNIGKKPILMTGATIKGLANYVFPSLTLQPGKFWVVGLYMLGFPKTYNRHPDDYHFYHFEDDAQYKLTLKDQFGNDVHEFAFSALRPWTEFTNGAGYTLVAKPDKYKDIADSSEKSKDSDFKFWRYSAKKAGSPWKDDPTPKTSRQIVGLNFHYVSYNDKKNQWIEIKSTAEKNIDLSDWVLTPGLHDSSEYVFPKGSIVKAGSSIVVKDIGFNLKPSSKVVLFQSIIEEGKSLLSGEYILFDLEDWILAFPE